MQFFFCFFFLDVINKTLDFTPASPNRECNLTIQLNFVFFYKAFYFYFSFKSVTICTRVSNATFAPIFRFQLNIFFFLRSSQISLFQLHRFQIQILSTKTICSSFCCVVVAGFPLVLSPPYFLHMDFLLRFFFPWNVFNFILIYVSFTNPSI